MSRLPPAPMPPELDQALGGTTADPLRRLWSALEDAAPPRPAVPDDAAALAALEARLDHPAADRPAPHPDRPAVRGRAGRRQAVVRWSALALVLTASAAGLWAWRQPVTAVAGAGEQVTVRLPDGSAATLNSGSRLRYARRFEAWPLVPSGARGVRLDGEAFFAVAHTGRPFVVETVDARVEVLGTQFDVRGYAEAGAGGTRVTLLSGRVRVATRTGAAVVLSQPGASTRVGSGAERPAPVTTVPLTHALAWRTDGFATVDEPLPAVLAEVARRFAVEVAAEGAVPADALNLFYPQGATAEGILHDVCLAQGCRFWRTSRGFGLRFTTHAEDA